MAQNKRTDPIWWGEEPRIMDTFVESHSFDGITMIPFCTSSSSGIGRSGQNLADNAGTGTWLDGKRFGPLSYNIAQALSGLSLTINANEFVENIKRSIQKTGRWPNNQNLVTETSY